MTLTEAAYWTRRFGVIILGVIAVFFIVTFAILQFNTREAPPEYLSPNFACTPTAQEFLQNKIEIPGLDLGAGSEKVFELETQTGTIDSLPRIINVHKFNILGQSLNSQAEAKIIAGKLGFDPEAIQRRGTTEYLWYDPARFRTLVVQARNLNFTVTTDYTKPNAVARGVSLPTDNEAKSIATSFLRGRGLLFEDYLKSTPEVVNINIEPDGTFSQANSKGEAELVRVDFYREKSMISIRSDMVGADQIKASLEQKLFPSTTESIVTDDGRVEIYNFDTVVTFENPNTPNISVYVGPINTLAPPGGDTTSKRIYGINFTYWPIETLPCGTYQLIPPAAAISRVQDGQASLVYLNEKNGDDVVPYSPRVVRKFTIYNISIGYLEPKDEAQFLQPIYIISGEATLSTGVIGNFHYYTPAIDYESVGNRVESPVETEEENNSLF